MGSVEAIGGINNGQFAASMGTVGSSGRIQQFHHYRCALMGVVGKGAQWFWLGAREWGRNSVHGGGVDRVTGLTTIF